MFLTILSFEIQYWFRKPLFYIYCGIMFFLSTFIMATAAGIFEGLTATINSVTIVNSALAINGLLNEMNVILFFLLPSIIGGTIYKDFENEMHSVMFSYPFKKWEYLSAKFVAGLIITLLVMSFAAIGIMLGSVLPGTNPDLLGPFVLMNYVQSFVYYLIPNLIFYGAVVFAVVTFTRNVSVGFLTVLGLIIVQGFASTLTQDSDNKILAALLDPFGSQANSYYTEYWTIYERNENPLPFGEIILYNRLIWTGIGLAIFGFVYRTFHFNQEAFSFKFFGKKDGKAVTKKNFGSIMSIKLPSVKPVYTFVEHLKSAWVLSSFDFKFVIKSWAFIIISILGFLLSLVTITVSSEIYGTNTLPVTWQMLEFPGLFFGLFINLLTFLYAGILIHRSRTDNIDQLIHVTPTPNWAILLSKFFALLKMQILLLLGIMLLGMGIQVYNGYFNFEMGLYLFELLAIKLPHILIWGLFAIFIHSFFKNFYIGFFLLLLISIGINFLGELGVEQMIFRFNDAPRTMYSDMNGYGASLAPYYIYKLYWLFLALAMYVLSIVIFRRGVPDSFKERLNAFNKEFNTKLKLSFSVFLMAFLGMGGWIWYTNNVLHENVSSKQLEKRLADWEKNYGKFEGVPQPRIVDVTVNLDLFPETRDFEASGFYNLVNKTDSSIDSIHIDHGSYISSFTFNKDYELVLEDDSMNYDIYQLGEPLLPGDSVLFSFSIKNKKNGIFKNNSPIRKNGTFINNSIFPRIGYNSQSELRGEESRKKYDLPPKERMAEPTDSAALQNTYIAYDADWVNFETTISTSPKQIAIAPGYLQKEWSENGRNYFHYKMDVKMLNFYSFISAEFEVVEDSWNDVAIEIYHHKDHDYNIDRMIKGIKRGLDYYTDQFSSYQHKQVRIIEFPRTGGGFAQSFANTIPYSEAVGFIASVDDENEDGVDYPFSITAHEVAHQWWAHQVIGANVQGATVMSESMSEYSSLKVLEKEYGSDKMRIFLKDALDKYLMGRALESSKEKPLLYNENQAYIHYNKGSLVLYALSDYIGEKNMNQALSKYIDAVAFQNPPYTTSLELLSYLDEATPDSLKYLLTDMFETITLYDNSVDEAEFVENEDSTFTVTLDFYTSKYRNSEKGKRSYTNAEGDSLSLEVEGRRRPIQSLPLADWIDVGVFGTDENGKEKVLYLEKHKISTIDNTISITVDELPTSAGIDPYHKLIDINSNDNTRALKVKVE